MHSVVEQIEKLFLPDLERLASHMRQRFPTLTFNVWHSPTGTLTTYQGYDLGVECIFPEALNDTPDNLALSIDLCSLTSAPRLMADVGWGHPGGQSEVTFRDNWLTNAEWPVVTPELVEELRGAFPRLAQAFEIAVERGVPVSPAGQQENT